MGLDVTKKVRGFPLMRNIRVGTNSFLKAKYQTAMRVEKEEEKLTKDNIEV